VIRYLLDTNAVIGLLNSATSPVAIKARQMNPREVGMSSIVAPELFYGAFKSARPTQNVALVDALKFEVVEFDKEDALRAGEVRAYLAKQGTPIGPYDVLIAGQALARGIILITHNIGEFGRVPGLQFEDWTII
jgi:tRNA(fMet)-specific endonuclease VapC